ncbi:hypothetical protein COOONC_20254 [Cooperia oncophora]
MCYNEFRDIQAAIHLFQYFSYQPCDIGVSPILCYSLRYPIASCMVACAALQVSMVIERGIALWKRRNYEHYGSRVGITLVIVSIIIGLSTILVVTSGITQKHPTSYCIINGIASPESIIIMKLTICVADLSALDWNSNVISVEQNPFEKSYDLQSSYQLFENTSVIRIILPLSICQTLFYVSFTISGTIVSFLYTDLDRITYITLTSATYTIPYYTVMSPILIWFTIRWSRQLKETKLKRLTRPIAGENDVYFKSYEEMFGIKPPVRRS